MGSRTFSMRVNLFIIAKTRDYAIYLTLHPTSSESQDVKKNMEFYYVQTMRTYETLRAAHAKTASASQA